MAEDASILSQDNMREEEIQVTKKGRQNEELKVRTQFMSFSLWVILGR